MKKTTVCLIVIVLLLSGYFLYDAKMSSDLFSQFLSGDRQTVEQISLSFMEDITFKDFQKASSYHHPDDQKKVNILS